MTNFPAEGCVCDPPSHSGHYSYCTLSAPVTETPEPAWFTALDEDDRAECRAELRQLGALIDSATDHPGALESALAAWKATGEALSDPAVREVLTGPLDLDEFIEAGPPPTGASRRAAVQDSAGRAGWVVAQKALADGHSAEFAVGCAVTAAEPLIYCAGRDDEHQRIRDGLMERQSVLAFVATNRHVNAVLVKDIEYVLEGSQ